MQKKKSHVTDTQSKSIIQEEEEGEDDEEASKKNQEALQEEDEQSDSPGEQEVAEDGLATDEDMHDHEIA